MRRLARASGQVVWGCHSLPLIAVCSSGRLPCRRPPPRHSPTPCPPAPPAVTTPMWRTVNGLTYCNADGEGRVLRLGSEPHALLHTRPGCTPPLEPPPPQRGDPPLGAAAAPLLQACGSSASWDCSDPPTIPCQSPALPRTACFARRRRRGGSGGSPPLGSRCCPASRPLRTSALLGGAWPLSYFSCAERGT